MNGRKGRVHSIQTLGTLDGPGVRFVVFLQGCPLRCGVCHNPDTHDPTGGREYAATALAERALRYREYFGREGGVTLSGGEPLLQADFAAAFFKECHARGLHTCLDTSGCILSGAVRTLLSHTDRVLLDIKYKNDALYRTHVGCGIDTPLSFLAELSARNIPTTLRQVTVPRLNDDAENDAFLAELIHSHPNIDAIELLPFRKLCSVKYENLGIPFPLAHYPEPDASAVAAREHALSAFLCK
ncbi:MAG: pyruvate formate lyase-activating protein [Clostridia bacterium]|nr:pyruvate formate lyase-activating protein [Clostridia bacterium]